MTLENKINIDEEETPTWKIILAIFLIILVFLISVIILISNLTALNGIIKISQLPSMMGDKNYSNYGINESGNYDCSWWESLNGDCILKCIKSCEMINKKGGYCVC